MSRVGKVRHMTIYDIQYTLGNIVMDSVQFIVLDFMQTRWFNTNAEL